MKKALVRASVVSVFALVSLFAGSTPLAQQAQPDLYVTVSYIKVLPGQDEAYRAYVTSTSKKVYQEMLGANNNLQFWSIARLMYNGPGEGNDYDYVAAAVFTGAPPEPGTNYDAVFQKTAGMTQADAQKKLATMRTIVGTEVLRNQARASTPGTIKEGDFRVVGRIRIKPGMGSEYYDAMKTMAQPMWQARIASGEVKGWSIWSRVFPAGAGTTYDALNVMYYKDLASAIQGPDATRGLETFMKTHPGKNYATYINNLRDYSELQQRLVMQVIALVERPGR